MGLEQVGDSEDMLPEMEALRGKTDSSVKGTALKQSIRGDFLYQWTPLEYFIKKRLVAWTVWKKPGKHIQNCVS